MLLNNEPDKFEHEYVSDWMGVGRNMAKSIKHWLSATQLAERSTGQRFGRNGSFELTHLGRMIIKHDPYLLERGTWWALHVNLVNNPEHAATWTWFFDRFLNVRFERATCIEALRRHLVGHRKRIPSLKTLQRDVACLLSTYAVDIPGTQGDPEDASDSPFRELRLLAHFRDSGTYGRQSVLSDAIAAELVPYSILTASNQSAHTEGRVEMSVREAFLMEGGPGRCFNLDLETLYELCIDAAGILGRDCLEVINLAGERIVRFRADSRENWLERYYRRIDQVVT